MWALHAAILTETADLSMYAQARTYYDGTAFAGLPLGQIGSYGATVRTQTLTLDDAVIDAAYASGSAVTSPPERPPYLPATGSGAVAWTSDYPADFRTACPLLAGYSWNPGGTDPDDHPGYFTEASRMRYDFHTGTGGSAGPPGTGVGLLQVTRDALGNETTINAYDPYKVRPLRVTGPTGLQTSAEYDYRILEIRQLTSANGNVSQCAFTPLGLVASVSVMGKPGENVGDTPSVPSLRYIYDLSAFDDPAHPTPISVQSIRRVYHVTDTSAPAADRSDTRQAMEYSDGFGRKIQIRAQAADFSLGSSAGGDAGLPLGPTTNAAAVGHQREAGDPANVLVTGWVIYDNKGHIVRSYEAFYSTGLEYQVPSGPQLGQHQDFYYDAPGRTIKTVNPDGSETLTVYGVPGTRAAPDLTSPAVFEPTPWETYTYDQNDNAGRTDPAGSAGYQSHWNTPASSLTDGLGRVVRATIRNGADPATDWFSTQTNYDIRGNVLTVTDALGRVTYRRLYDYASRCLRIDSLDAGIRRSIADAASSIIEERPGNGSLTLTGYDPMRLPVRVWARDPADTGVTLREIAIYGESPDSGMTAAAAAASNLLGQVCQHYDEAGLATLAAADFKGNPLSKIRQVFAASVVADAAAFAADWQAPAGSSPAAYAAACWTPPTRLRPRSATTP